MVFCGVLKAFLKPSYFRDVSKRLKVIGSRSDCVNWDYR